MTREQFKAAKAMLGLSNPDLAEMTGLHRNTLNNLDKGNGKASTVKFVQMTLESQGVQFLDSGAVASGPGVAMGGGTAGDKHSE